MRDIENRKRTKEVRFSSYSASSSLSLLAFSLTSATVVIIDVSGVRTKKTRDEAREEHSVIFFDGRVKLVKKFVKQTSKNSHRFSHSFQPSIVIIRRRATMLITSQAHTPRTTPAHAQWLALSAVV